MGDTSKPKSIIVDGFVGKLPPSALDAEMCVLASMMLDRACIDPVAALVQPDSFYSPDNRDICSVILDLNAVNKPIDVIILRAELDRRCILEEIGGSAYLGQILNTVPSAAHAIHYAGIVREKALLRKAITAANQILKDAYDAHRPADEVVQEAAVKFGNLLGSSAGIIHHEMEPVLMEVWNDLEQGGIPMLSTGIAALDKVIGGLANSELVIVGARPSMGKSLVAKQIANNLASGIGHPSGTPTRVGYISIEESRKKFARNIVSNRSDVCNWKIRKAALSPDEFKRVADTISAAAKLPILIDDSSYTLPQVISSASAMKAKGCKAIFVDYLQLIDACLRGEKNDTAEVKHIAQELKRTAKRLDIPLVALAQLNRTSEMSGVRKPRMSDLKQCVTGDTRLIDADTGRMVAIRDVKPGSRVMSVNASQKIVPGTVGDVWSTGAKPVYEMTTRTGRRIRATSNHPFLTAGGWKQLGELSVGQTIATAMRTPQFDTATSRGDESRLLGYLVGNGGYQNCCGLSFVTPDADVMQDFKAITSSMWPQLSFRDRRVRNCHAFDITRLYENGYGKPFGNPIREWLRGMGVFGQSAASKRVPAWVFEGGNACARNFVAGYLATDGCVKVRCRNQGKPTWGVQFDTVSRGLADDVQDLLTRLGIVSCIGGGSFNTKSTMPIYRIAVASDADNLGRFALNIPCCGKKGELLKTVLQELPAGRTSVQLLGLPNEASQRAARLGVWRDQGKRMRRDVCERLYQQTGDLELREWAESDLLWEEIRSIKPAGSEETFDISIPQFGCFVGNGIVAHNSGQIEQDADVVILLHREDYYKRNEQGYIPDGKLEMIVGKNRDGEVGTVLAKMDEEHQRIGEWTDVIPDYMPDNMN